MASCGSNGGGTCQSLCLRAKEDELQPPPPTTAAVREEDTRDKLGSMGDQARCSKCGEEKPSWNGLCLPCFRSSLFGKFKLAVTSNAMIAPSDKVLVAFSGGPASRVALQFIHELQCKSLKNWHASKSQGLPVFGVGVAFVNGSAVSPDPSDVISNIFEEINSVLSELTPPQKVLHVTSIESIFCENFDDGRRCYNELLDSIADATGKEDFAQYLRMLSLQKVALDNKYTKLLLGSCTSNMARLIISATVKEENPSRERTIVRTGEKLKAFSFNRFTQDGYYDFLPSIIRPKFQNVNYAEESIPKFFCPICGSPLSDSEWQHLKDVQISRRTKVEMFTSQCCRSCRFQILPKERSSLEKFYSLLPSSIANRMEDQGCADQRWLREQIEEFLINDDEDST